MFKYYITINYLENRYINLEVDSDIFIKYINNVARLICNDSKYELQAIDKDDILKYVIKHNDVYYEHIRYDDIYTDIGHIAYFE